MASFSLQDDQNVDVALSFADAAGRPVTGVALDAGSVTASFADATEWTVTVSADQSTVNVRATGALVTGDLLTVTGTLAGTALTPGTLAFDEVASAPTAITLTPGTPATNA